MSLFTGKGDQGTTKLFDTPSGVRVSKASPIFECLGQLDELNALLGWCKFACDDSLVFQNKSIKELLHQTQDYLFTIQAEAAGASQSIDISRVEALSQYINDIEKELPEVKTFLVLGGTELSARLDIARAVSRRTERCLIQLHDSGERAISEGSRAYMNRLSSLLYALTRLVNHRAGIIESAPRYQGTLDNQ